MSRSKTCHEFKVPAFTIRTSHSGRKRIHHECSLRTLQAPKLKVEIIGDTLIQPEIRNKEFPMGAKGPGSTHVDASTQRGKG